MNKKLVVLLAMVVSFIPSTVLASSSPLEKYSLYDDVFGGSATADPERESAMKEYYNNSLRASQNAANNSNGGVQKSGDVKDGISRMTELNKAYTSTLNSKVIPEREKLIRLKSINKQMKTVLDAYFMDDPDYNSVKQTLEENDKLLGTISDSKLSAEQKQKAVEEHNNSSNNASNSKILGGSVSSFNLSSSQVASMSAAAELEGRNEYLRTSSKKVYSKSDTPAHWSQGPYFYDNPTLASIIQKYKMSNFAGCMQESEAYVKKYPHDTLGFYYLAMSYAKINDKENAVKAYEKVIALNDNPMIVKYATNGRNCVLGQSDAKCYQDVNIPELKYPYADIAADMDLTPISAEELANKNYQKIQSALTEGVSDAVNAASHFSAQDENLDAFINAPYGSGFSPELEEEYAKLQLKHLKENINKEQDGPGEYYKNFNNVKSFDNSQS